MATQFGSYLVEVGAVSPLDLLEALELQRRRRPLIGRIALTHKLLTVSGLMKVLETQTDRPEPFGQIAVKLGLLDDAKVARLMDLQRKATPGVGSILVEMGKLTPDALSEYAAAWRELHQELAAEAANAAAL